MPGVELGSPVVIHHPPGKQLADHRLHIARIIGRAHDGVAHRAAGAESHLLGLQVVAGARKQLVIARVVVVHMADDDIGHELRIDTDGRKSRRDGLHQLPATRGAHDRIESGIEHE